MKKYSADNVDFGSLKWEKNSSQRMYIVYKITDRFYQYQT